MLRPPHRQHHLSFLVWVIPLMGSLGVFLWALNYHYPLIGHDNVLYIAWLLSGRWHFARQGLLPFRFNPHFCGGFPQYGNPQDMYYSLPQFFSFFLDPWIAVQIASIIVLCIGYVGWYFFGRDILRMENYWAHLFSLMIVSNGFSLVHAVAGHLVFHTVPLIGLLLWLLLERSERNWPALLRRAGIFGLISLYILHSGYPLALVLTGLAFFLLLPIELLLCGEQIRNRTWNLCKTVFACSIVSLLLGASKLIAVWSLMRVFPRHMPFDTLAEGSSSLLFFARAFWYIPQGKFLFTPANVPWGVHEYSMFLSPVTLMAFLAVPLLLHRRSYVLLRWKHRIVGVYGVFVLLFFLQLGDGHGPLVDLLSHAPLIRSMHVTMRFVYLLSLFVIGISIVLIRHILRTWEQHHWERWCALLASLMTVAAVPFSYFPMLHAGEIGLTLDYETVKQHLHPPLFLKRPITYVYDGPSDLEHVLFGTSGIHCGEPLFGYFGAKNQITFLSEGAVKNGDKEYFNLNNPACFQYPEENACSPGDRIKVSDEENLLRFLSGENTTWKLSRLQRWGDRVSVFTLLCIIFSLLFAFWRHFQAQKMSLQHVLNI